MALDFQQLYQQIQQVGDQALSEYKRLQDIRKQAIALLQEHANNLDALRQKVDQAMLEVPSLRCAVPTQEPLNAHYPPPDLMPGGLVLAADGSQIFPNRHDALHYYLINIGTLTWELDDCAAPSINSQPRLCYGDAMYSNNGQQPDISVERDFLERQSLAEQAQTARQTAKTQVQYVVTLTDGTLELWGSRASGDSENSGLDFLKKKAHEYRELLEQLQRAGAITAAYVDKPSGELVVRLLDLTLLSEKDLGLAGKNTNLRGFIDEQLFASFLGAGERSALFELQFMLKNDYAGDLAIHFFYLNVGSAHKPSIARVEIPAWVADSPLMLNQLHAVLLQQCHVLGAEPYPYLLHRAHETAVVSLQEKEQVNQMLNGELLRRQIPLGNASNKQHHKMHPGRTSFSRGKP